MRQPVYYTLPTPLVSTDVPFYPTLQPAVEDSIPWRHYFPHQNDKSRPTPNL